MNLVQLIEAAPVDLPPLEVTGLHEQDDVSPLEAQVLKIKRPMRQLAHSAAAMLDRLLLGQALLQREQQVSRPR